MTRIDFKITNEGRLNITQPTRQFSQGIVGLLKRNYKIRFKSFPVGEILK